MRSLSLAPEASASTNSAICPYMFRSANLPRTNSQSEFGAGVPPLRHIFFQEASVLAPLIEQSEILRGMPVSCLPAGRHHSPKRNQVPKKGL